MRFECDKISCVITTRKYALVALFLPDDIRETIESHSVFNVQLWHLIRVMLDKRL